MLFARDHLLARGISGAVRPWRPTYVGLHGRTVSKRAELAYMDFEKYLRMRRSDYVWQVKAGLRQLKKTIRRNGTTGLNCTVFYTQEHGISAIYRALRPRNPFDLGQVRRPGPPSGYRGNGRAKEGRRDRRTAESSQDGQW